ncbi:hypothetical protein PanWU01x14_049740 [Parasponia andersonii]|uniref:Uncharacterized protein n=1 Tax=Parasponia andersonii TaxID=3476 RepID=A0A2P5DMR3_PARAD|nr:hypothetical protein PanWU01x14_049740 [Parasponia andersonii]
MVVLNGEWWQNDEIGYEDLQLRTQNSNNKRHYTSMRRAARLRPIMGELLQLEFWLGSKPMADDWRRN